MFDFLRDRGSTADDKRREALGAYLDNALTPAERAQMEGRIAGDPALRAELEQMRVLKLQMRSMPRRRVPRSFALNPALYGRPKSQPMLQLYPALRGATALTAILLIFTLALGAFGGQFTGGDLSPAVSDASSAETMAQEAALTESVEEVELAAPAAADTERAKATPALEMEAAAEAPAEADLAAGNAPVVTGVPEGDLAFQVPTTAVEPTAAIEMAPEPTSIASAEFAADETVDNYDSAPADEGVSTSATWLRPAQIGLSVVFLLLFVFWLIARRRVRSL